METETVSGRVRQRKYLSGALLNQNDIIFNGAELNPDWNTWKSLISWGLGG